MIVLIVSLLVIVAVLAVVFIDRLAKEGIERGGKAALGVPTTVKEVNIGLFSGQAGLENLNVGNPEGFPSPQFLTLKAGAVAVSLASLTKDVIEVPYIELEGIDLYIEKNKDGQANYQVIMDGQQEHERQPAKTDEPGESGKKFVVRQVKIRNVTMHADVLPVGGPVLVVVPEILLTDVGTADGAGVNTAEVVNILVKAIFASAIANGQNLLPADVLNDMTAGLDKLTSLTGNGIQIAGQALGDTAKDATKAAGDAAKAAGEKLENAAGAATEKVGEGINKVLNNPLKKDK